VVVAGPSVVAMHRLLNADGAGHRIDHAGERDHQAVAQVLDLLAAVRRGDPTQELEVQPPKALGVVVTKAGEQLGRAHEVREQQRYQAPLRDGRFTKGGAGSGSGGCRGAREGGSALAAELRVGSVGRAAVRAGASQSGAAFVAELAAGIVLRPADRAAHETPRSNPA
jgi:hypothetical protein